MTNNIFNKEWMPLSELSKEFDMPSSQFNLLLQRLGLRCKISGNPTQKAKDDRIADLILPEKELSKEFDMPSSQFNLLLQRLGLRCKISGNPTQKAKDDRIADLILPEKGAAYFLWHRARLSQYLLRQDINTNQ